MVDLQWTWGLLQKVQWGMDIGGQPTGVTQKHTPQLAATKSLTKRMSINHLQSMLEQDIHTKDKNCVKLQNYSLVDQRG